MADNYKLVILGSGGVGKSAITMQFVSKEYNERYNPTIEDSYTKLVHFEGRAVKVDLLDTAGQEEYSAMRDQYMRFGEGYILVYSITDPSSFYEVKEMYEQLLRSKDVDSGTIPVIFVGNKCDIEEERTISTEEAEEFVRSCGGYTSFIECSAKKNLNIDQIFDTLLTNIVRKVNGKEEEIEEEVEESSSKKMPAKKRRGTMRIKKLKCNIM